MSYQVGFLDVAILRLEHVSLRLAQYMDTKMVDIAIEEILDPLVTLARSRKISQRFIDALEIRKLGYMKVAIVLNEFLTPTGAPLNILLEKGWSEFYTAPVNVFALHWMEFGAHFFSMGHWVRGFPGYDLLGSMDRWGFVERFYLRIIKDAEKYLEATKFK